MQNPLVIILLTMLLSSNTWANGRMRLLLRNLQKTLTHRPFFWGQSQNNSSHTSANLKEPLAKEFYSEGGDLLEAPSDSFGFVNKMDLFDKISRQIAKIVAIKIIRRALEDNLPDKFSLLVEKVTRIKEEVLFDEEHINNIEERVLDDIKSKNYR